MSEFSETEHTISPDIRRKLELIDALAKGDEVYRQMFSELIRLEQAFLDIEPEIPPAYRDRMWDYFSLSESMTHRLLELACQYMEFPQ